MPPTAHTATPHHDVDPGRFRQALGTFITGVTVLTTTDQVGRPVGMTANAFTSVSLDPPLVLVCIGVTTSTFQAIDAASRYAVHVLGDGQRAISTTFARGADQGIDKFADIEWTSSPTGVPLINGCLARLECRTVERVPAGDHVIYIGQVDALELAEDATSPLGFFRGGYAELA